jgi:hypothetical protein
LRDGKVQEIFSGEATMTHWRYAVIAVILAGFATVLEGLAWAEIGQIKNVAGEVFIFRNNVQQPAKAGNLIEQADVVTTGPNSSVGITFIDNSRFSAGPNSRIELKQFRFNPTTHEGEFLKTCNELPLSRPDRINVSRMP